MSKLTDEARKLADKANECRTEGAIGFLVLAIDALCDALDEHQHSYFGPATMHGKWATTGEQRDTGAAAHAQYLKQQADKKKPKS